MEIELRPTIACNPFKETSKIYFELYIDDEYVFSFMNKAEVDERLDAIIEQYKKENKWTYTQKHNN